MLAREIFNFGPCFVGPRRPCNSRACLQNTNSSLFVNWISQGITNEMRCIFRGRGRSNPFHKLKYDYLLQPHEMPFCEAAQQHNMDTTLAVQGGKGLINKIPSSMIPFRAQKSPTIPLLPAKSSEIGSQVIPTKQKTSEFNRKKKRV